MSYSLNLLLIVVLVIPVNLLVVNLSVDADSVGKLFRGVDSVAVTLFLNVIWLLANVFYH